MFSRWGLPLKHTHALCRTDLAALIEKSFTPTPMVVQLNEQNPVANWSGYVESLEGFKKLKGVTKPHAWRWQRSSDGKQVETLVKDWCRSRGWAKPTM
jgi:hypothetical protein